MKNMDRVLFGCLALLLPISGFACSTAQWTSNSGAVVVGSPQTNPAVPRYSELCGMQITAPNSGYVQDNSPDAHTQFIARFYVRPNIAGTGEVDLFVAYGAENGTLPRLKVSYNAATAALGFHTSSTLAATTPAAAGLWHLVEVEYNSAGDTRFWVNSNAISASPIDTYPNASGVIESVRLGFPNAATGYTGTAQFDSYESHSSTPVGPLLLGDSNGNLSVNVFDMISIQNEILGTNLAVGQPDCNRQGTVNVFDMICVQNIILGN